MRRALWRLALSLSCSALLAGCAYQGVTSLPLPGAIDGAGTYAVTAIFDDTTNLVSKETCRANDVTVGSITAIKLGPDLRARVTCAITDTVRLPANTVATLEETSLLGERYVALGPPVGAAPSGQLRPGTVITNNENRAAPDTEEVLGSLSMVLNGGNLQAIRTISSESNQALSGHENDIRSVLDRLTTLTGVLDTHSADITRSLDSLNQFSGTVAQQRQVLAGALDTIPDGLRVLNDQRGRLVNLLSNLSDLSHAATSIVNDSKANTLSDLHALNPVLTQLAGNGRSIAPALEMLSFPIPRNGLEAVKGDFAGAHITVHVDMNTINTLLAQEAKGSIANGGPPPDSGPAARLIGPRSSLPSKLGGPEPLERLLIGGGR